MKKFRLGHLFFKYIQGTPLESSQFNSSTRLAAELVKREIITLSEKQDGVTWYSYQKNLTKNEVINLLKGAA